MSSPIQTIFFGSPGTGKSHHVKNVLLPQLGIKQPSADCIPTVFHPEYSYGDFMGKLLPLSVGGKVEYKYHAGHFLTALARAYKNLLFKEDSTSSNNVALVIDEINRGNSAAIFGTIFQLLDRQSDGWSTYEIAVSEMEFDTLLEKMGARINRNYDERGRVLDKYYAFPQKQYTDRNINELFEPIGLIKEQIKLPPNLSLIATMNTSDNSIYYMDTAFKRRWDWQFIDNDSKASAVTGNAFENRAEWVVFVDKLNKFVRESHRFVRKVEDKQIGHWFIVGEAITKSQVQNKVMFYLWDSVFGTSRKPLADLLGVGQEDLVTFGDFAGKVDAFIDAINRRSL